MSGLSAWELVCQPDGPPLRHSNCYRRVWMPASAVTGLAGILIDRTAACPGQRGRQERQGRAQAATRPAQAFWHAEGTQPAGGIMKRSRQPVIWPFTCYFTGAPGRIRTRDPLLRRYIRRVAGRRLLSPYELSSSGYYRWPSEGVVRSLPPLAPRLAPRNLLAFSIFE
jgi:hypothetical protein